MKAAELRFTGSVPAGYQDLMVPLFFRPYAEELALRARSLQPHRILETAAGTGAVTRALHNALPEAEIVATDLNPPMLNVAASQVHSDKLRFQQADAQSLPFDDKSFDLVVCQFGAMFFPDRVKGHAEAHRVLRDGGRYLLAIWDRIESNPLSAATQDAMVEVFSDDPPMFLRDGPFSYSDAGQIEADLREVGFENIRIETVGLRSQSPSARDAASALCYGTPMAIEVEDREAGSLDRCFEAVERALAQFDIGGGIDEPMSAHIVTAAK